MVLQIMLSKDYIKVINLLKIIDKLKFMEGKLAENKKTDIPLKSTDLERIFNNNIANYGYKYIERDCTSDKTKGEGYEETYRTYLRRQRDKILYTGGFRRLQDKTQVIPATISGDHRTRLTHTLEVEQIAVSVANALKLNTDLVSAIALGHDVGHTPFGHAAERKLAKVLSDDGAFHHPIQSVRYLWEKYGDSLDQKIYEGILLHDSDMFEIDKDIAKNQLKYIKTNHNELELKDWILIDQWINNAPSTLEAQVVIWADKIAYITHDLEDFLRCSVYKEDLIKNNDIKKELCEILNNLIDKREVINDPEEFKLRDLIRNIISNLIISSKENINSFESLEQENVKKETMKRINGDETSDKKKKFLNGLIINFDEKYRENYYKLRKFLNTHYIFSTKIQRTDTKAEIIVNSIFNILKSNYKLLPLNIRNEVDYLIEEKKKELTNSESSIGKTKTNSCEQYGDIKEEHKNSSKNNCSDIKDSIVSRKVACYIATMTDSYAENMYKDLIGNRVDFIL